MARSNRRQLQRERQSRIRVEGLEPRLPLSGFGDFILMDSDGFGEDGFFELPGFEDGNPDGDFGGNPDLGLDPGGPNDLEPPSAPAIESMEPSNGSELEAPPEKLTIVFNAPLDPLKLTQGLIKLVRVEANGSETKIFGPSSSPPFQLDQTGTRLTFTLSATLERGKYRVLLDKNAYYAGQDGTEWMGDGLTDELIGTFQVVEVETLPLPTPKPPDQSGSNPKPPEKPSAPPPVVTNPPAIVKVEPGSGAVLKTGPKALTIVFDRPLDPKGLPFGAFVLVRIQSDGTSFPAWNPSKVIEQLDSTGKRLTISGDQALEPGRYRLVFQANATVLGANGKALVNGSKPKVVVQFEVAKPEQAPSTPNLMAGAINLGTIGSTPKVVSGQLNFLANPKDLKLYRIVLPEGHFWRLGLEVTGQRDGSLLRSGLALFDASGNLIAARDLGTWDAPGDPYLFAGLKPGVYYVGVSGAGNLPNRPGGYDLVNDRLGTVQPTQAGGSFRLHLVADPADTPTHLINFRVDRADPADPNPTGFTLQFDGPIRLGGFDGLTGLNDSGTNIEVVDQDGRVWPVVAVRFDPNDARISFLFLDRLPLGRYEVRLSEGGSLTDLAGQPIKVEGQPDGVLGRFEVTTELSERDPNNLGALRPGDSEFGVRRTLQLQPGESATIRFVILGPEIQELWFGVSAEGLEAELVGPNGRFPLDVSAENIRLSLEPGVYHLRLKASGAKLLDLDFQIFSVQYESYLFNGIGQGPALNLRLVSPTFGIENPTNPGSGPSSPSTPLPPATQPTPVTVPLTPDEMGGGSGGSFNEAIPTGPINVLLTYGTGMVGRPLSEAARFAADGGGIGVASVAALTEGPDLGRLVDDEGWTSTPQASSSHLFAGLDLRPDWESGAAEDLAIAAAVQPPHDTLAHAEAAAVFPVVDQLWTLLERINWPWESETPVVTASFEPPVFGPWLDPAHPEDQPREGLRLSHPSLGMLVGLGITSAWVARRMQRARWSRRSGQHVRYSWGPRGPRRPHLCNASLSFNSTGPLA